MAARKMVVTGGAGFIGSHLTDALVQRGDNVWVVDSLVNGKRENVHRDATLAEADVRDVGALAKLFRDADTVFHLAALPRVQFSLEHPALTAEVNLMGTVNVLCAAQAAKARRVVFASSSSVFGDQSVLPLEEGMRPNPLSPYATQKWCGEIHCRIWAQVYGLETVSLRFFNVYGPRFDPSGPYALVIGKFIGQRMRGEALTICGDGLQTRDFTHVSDVVRACLLACDAPNTKEGQVINIGAGDPVSVNHVAQMIGGPALPVDARAGEPRHTHADITRAANLLGWKPQVRVHDGIAGLKRLLGIP